ncbi:hypothetical protein [uncultured Flavobacterium sp.]|uniref:hypothetical protein n=1 Tax=uncultured Flavobacterium sp. TaxID=165435 RepID=UPI0030EC51C4
MQSNIIKQSNLIYIEELSAGDQVFKLKIIDIIKYELPIGIAVFEKKLIDKKLNEAA